MLLLDIETSPILAYVWSIWEQNVGLNQIHTDWCVLAWSAKWLGDKEIFYRDQRNKKHLEDDKGLLKELWRLLDDADVIVTQNGKSFDAKKLNARFIIHGFKPPSPYKHIDTKIMAKRNFGFTSNKLEYLSDKLCSKYKKLTKRKFSGFELWRECIGGNITAWNEMERYNKLDVLSLEELYTKLAPWWNPVDLGLYHDDTEPCHCGGEDFQRRGYTFSGSSKYHRYQCKKCGSWSRGVNSIQKNKPTRRRIV